MSEKVFIQVQCDEEVRQMVKKIVKYHDSDVSKWVRTQIKAEYALLPRRAKR